MPRQPPLYTCSSDTCQIPQPSLCVKLEKARLGAARRRGESEGAPPSLPDRPNWIARPSYGASERRRRGMMGKLTLAGRRRKDPPQKMQQLIFFEEEGGKERKVGKVEVDSNLPLPPSTISLGINLFASSFAKQVSSF